MSRTAPPAPNKIHTLPVVVTYHIPSSSETFSAILSAPQQVYVHPPSSAAGDEETWGSIYLKTVVQGVLMSSPELIPSPTSDLSIYTRDPRETYLRKSRENANMNFSSPRPSQAGEVWTGKGLCSWALDEPGQGKNLITGRVITSPQFQLVSPPNLSPLEALAASFRQNGASAEGTWGIEVFVSLRDSTSLVAKSTLPLGVVESRASSIASGSTTPLDAHPSKTPAGKYVPSSKSKSTSGKKKKAFSSHSSHRDRLVPIDGNRPARPAMRTRKSSGNSADSDSSSSASEATFPTDIPAALYTKPDSLTKEQAQRLLASPAFLSMLERVTGAPLESAKRKAEAGTSGSVKRSRADGKKDVEGDELKCWNCGRTKSAVWRSKVMEDGRNVRVCNACGLYWNKLRVMRPPTLWQAVDEESRERKRKPLVPPARTPLEDTSSPAPTPGSDPATGFKRTLTTFVNRDAQRLASLKTKPKSALHQSSKAAPATSPVRPLRTAAARVKFEPQVAASSPGWAPEASDSVPQSDTFEPVKMEPAATPIDSVIESIIESPNTAIRRLIGTVTAPAPTSQTNNNIQSLQMPLSDDGPEPSMPLATSETQWDDFSAFFDVDAFAMEQDVAPSKTHGRSPTPETTDFHRALSSGSRRKREGKRTAVGISTDAADDDDVLSQLFHRTSSMGVVSSSPTRFDFSTLPPSSPPMLPDFSALLSSPEVSPMGMGFSPLETQKISPAERRESGLQTTFTPAMTMEAPHPVGSESQVEFDLEEMERILRDHGADLSALFDPSSSGSMDFNALLQGM